MINKIKNELKWTFSNELIENLIECYRLVKKKYYLGNYRPCSHEAGRFAEVVMRMLQQTTKGNYTPLGTSLPNFADEVKKLAQLSTSSFCESIRIQIPRTLQVIYDIRNKRDVGHVGGEVDANFSDATLSYTSCSWVLTELLRIYYTSNIDEAQKLVNDTIKIKIPIIQDFDGFLKILKPNLSLPNKILALLYYRASKGATKQELKLWLKKVRTDHFNSTLYRLEHDKAFIHISGDTVLITDSGLRYVEKNIPLELEI